MSDRLSPWAKIFLFSKFPIFFFGGKDGNMRQWAIDLSKSSSSFFSKINFSPVGENFFVIENSKFLRGKMEICNEWSIYNRSLLLLFFLFAGGRKFFCSRKFRFFLFFWGERWKHATMSNRFIIEVFFLLFFANKFFCSRKFQIFEGKKWKHATMSDRFMIEIFSSSSFSLVGENFFVLENSNFFF